MQVAELLYVTSTFLTCDDLTSVGPYYLPSQVRGAVGP